MYRLRCFGGATVLDPEDQEVHFRSRKHLALLLYLAAHGNQSLTRRRLVRLFWDTEESLARHSLSQGLYDLKKRLSSFEIHARAGTVRIAGDQLLYEGARFEEALQSEDLRTAVELFRGDFAPNLQSVGTREFERWLEGERTRFRTLGHVALRRFARECDERGDWPDMCLAALRMVRLDPLDERGHRALMRALWLQGDRPSALQHFEEVKHRLERELPSGVSRETRALAERIRSTRMPVRMELDRPEATLPMVGREREFQVLRGSVRRLGKGAGGLVVVRGEAGIGKTRLMEELVHVATVEGLNCLESRCYPAESDVAYGPVLDGIQPVAREVAAERTGEVERYYQLGHLFPELFGQVSEEAFEAIDPAVRRRRLFEELTDLLRRVSRRRGVLWVVEDIQWIDSASASLLHYIRRRLKNDALLLVVTLRLEERQKEAVSRLIEATSAESGTETIELEPLRSGAVRELLESATSGMRRDGALDLAVRYCGGNPFYALEILQAATSARDEAELASAATLINDRLRNLLKLRLRGLSATSLRLLEAVAVLERHATPENVLAVTGLRLEGAAAITSELNGRRLLHDNGERLEFPHDITREYIYSNLGSLQRAALHLTVGEVLAERSDVSPATLARHFEEGGDRRRAYRYAMRAATSSAASSAHDEAARMATLALEVATSDEEKLEALCLLSKMQSAAGHFRFALDTSSRVLGEYSNLSPTKRRSLLLRCANAATELCEWNLAQQYIASVQESLDMQRPDDDVPRHLVRALALTIKVCISRNDADGAHAAAGSLHALYKGDLLSQPLSTAVKVDAACALAAHASFLVSSDSALTLLDELSPLVDEASPSTLQQFLTTRGIILLRKAQWTAAKRTLEQALEIAQRFNDLVRAAHIKNNLACLELERGNARAAVDLCRTSRRMYTELMIGEFSALQPLVNLANARFYQCRFAEASSLFGTAYRICSDDTPAAAQSPILEISASLGLVALASGKPDDATSYWQKLRAYSQGEFVGLQERYKIEWFAAAMDQLSNAGNGGPARRLQAAAAAERDKDAVQHLKLCWLSVLFGGDSSEEQRVAQQLRDNSLNWFRFFSKRWLRRATALRVASPAGSRL